ncbi:MAG: hypothetical protein LBL66_04605 [Clostridiales bacterium]|nr:hypothetical protein [Clostridiales bacterium]
MATAKEIYEASGGRGYVENGELHLMSPQVHYVYKFEGSPAGWHMRNDRTKVDYYLGGGASPTVNLENIEVKDEAYWGEIVYTPETAALAAEVQNG